MFELLKVSIRLKFVLEKTMIFGYIFRLILISETSLYINMALFAQETHNFLLNEIPVGMTFHFVNTDVNMKMNTKNSWGKKDETTWITNVPDKNTDESMTDQFKKKRIIYASLDEISRSIKI